MANPTDGRSSTEEFYDKGTPLPDAKPNNKNIEHSNSGIANTVKKPDDATSYQKEVEKTKEKEEKEGVASSSNSNEEEFEDETTSTNENVNQKYSKRKTRTTPIKSMAFKLYYFLTQLREMYIRRVLRGMSNIFENLGIYEKGKILDEANYQQLSYFSEGARKLKKLAADTKYETSKAKSKFNEYFDHDYQDPRNFIRHANSALNESRKVSLGGGINIEISTKELIEDVSKTDIMGKVKHKAIKEFDEEREEIAEEVRKEKLAKLREISEKIKNNGAEKIKMKLSYKSKPINERKEVRRREGTSFKAISFDRTLPSLKRFVTKDKTKVQVKSTWSSLARHIQYSAKSYSFRTRSERIKEMNRNFAKAYRTPTSKIAEAMAHRRKISFT